MPLTQNSFSQSSILHCVAITGLVQPIFIFHYLLISLYGEMKPKPFAPTHLAGLIQLKMSTSLLSPFWKSSDRSVVLDLAFE